MAAGSRVRGSLGLIMCMGSVCVSVLGGGKKADAASAWRLRSQMECYFPDGKAALGLLT